MISLPNWESLVKDQSTVDQALKILDLTEGRPMNVMPKNIQEEWMGLPHLARVSALAIYREAREEMEGNNHE